MFVLHFFSASSDTKPRLPNAVMPGRARHRLRRDTTAAYARIRAGAVYSEIVSLGRCPSTVTAGFASLASREKKVTIRQGSFQEGSAARLRH